MAATKDTNKWGLLTKLETEYGTDPTPVAGTDGQLVQEEPLPSLSFLHDGSRRGRNPGTLAEMKRVGMSGIESAFTAVIEATGFGAVYTATDLPNIHTLLRACGMAPTVDLTPASEFVSYDPISSAWESITAWAYSRGQEWKMNGMYGTFSISCEGPSVPVWEFTLRGKGNVPTDVALPAITYSPAATVIPPKATSIALNIGDYTGAVVRSFNYTHGQSMGPRANLNSAGHAGLGMGRREPRLEVLIEADALKTSTPWHAAAQLNPMELMQSGQELATISLAVGTAQWNKWTLLLNDAYLIEAEPQDDDPSNALWRLVLAPSASSFVLNDDMNILFD